MELSDTSRDTMSTRTNIEIPNNLGECQALVVELAEELANIRGQLEVLLRARYGRKSEQLADGQLRLFDGADSKAAVVDVAPAEKTSSRGHGRRKPNRDLPRVPVIYDVLPEELACPDCCREREVIGQEVSEQYDYTPASIQIVEHIRLKRACRACHGHVVTAMKPPTVIEKGLATANMLAYVATSKYVDHLPLNRIESILKRDGATISRSTMCDWMAATAAVLQPLYERLRQRVLESKVIWTDDTPVKMQDRSDDRNMRNARIWCYLGDARNPYTVFDFTDSRKRDGPVEFLNGFDGFLQADAFAGYDCIYASGQVKEAACWAHARRKFFDARPSDMLMSTQATTFIGELYGIERSAMGMSDAEREEKRAAESAEVLLQLKGWLDKQKVRALPKSPLGKAITYTLNNWNALNTFTTYGALTIDNNKSERTLRPTAIGRKNWLFFGSREGGKTAATICTVLASAKQHNLHPRVYLADVLTRLVTSEIDLDALLPDRWRAEV